MESLDTFRHSWHIEISKDKPQQSNSTNDTPNTSTGDLCRIGINFKDSLERQTPIPLSSQSAPSFQASTNNGAFTIGIRTFTIPPSKTSTSEPPLKKSKTSTSTLLDELIRDIDESTDVPFFNISLPREIALQIFDYLSVADLYSCLRVCKSWHSLSSDELLWYNLYKRLKFHHANSKSEESWKNSVKEAILFNQQLVQNFKTHQCRTTKLTNRLGIVLTCANNNSTTIVAGYSTGIIRTWSIDAILNADENDEQLTTPDIIYESTDHTSSSVKSVGLLKNDIYALHDDGLVELWRKDAGGQPRFTQRILPSPIVHVAYDEHFLCTASRSKFHAWNVSQVTIANRTVPIVFLCIKSFRLNHLLKFKN